MVNIPLFARFHTCEVVVWDFFHQQDENLHVFFGTVDWVFEILNSHELTYVNPFWLGFLCMGIIRSHRCTDRENCQWSFFKMIIWSWDGLSISNRIHVWYVYLHQPNVGKYTTHGCYGYGFAKTLPWLPPPHRYSTLCWYCLLSLPSIHQVYSSGTYQL